MDVQCTDCGKLFPIAESYLGRRTRCPWCESRQIVRYESLQAPQEVVDSEGWYWRSPDGEQAGPVPLSRLLELRDDHILSEEWQVWRTGWAKWYFVDRLFASFLDTRGTSTDRPPRSMAHRAVAALEVANQWRHGAESLADRWQQLHQILLSAEIGSAALALTAVVLGAVAKTLAWGLVVAASLAVAGGMTDAARRRAVGAERALRDVVADGELAASKIAIKRQQELVWRLTACLVTWAVLAAAALLTLVAVAG